MAKLTTIEQLNTQLLKKSFNNPKERHENQAALRPEILKKRLYEKNCTEQEKQLIKKRLEFSQNL